MNGCIVIVLAVHIHIHIYMIYDKTRILLNPFVLLLLGCKSSYTSIISKIIGIERKVKVPNMTRAGEGNDAFLLALVRSSIIC